MWFYLNVDVTLNDILTNKRVLMIPAGALTYKCHHLEHLEFLYMILSICENTFTARTAHAQHRLSSCSPPALKPSNSPLTYDIWERRSNQILRIKITLRSPLRYHILSAVCERWETDCHTKIIEYLRFWIRLQTFPEISIKNVTVHRRVPFLCTFVMD